MIFNGEKNIKKGAKTSLITHTFFLSLSLSLLFFFLSLSPPLRILHLL
jgi:hypothetical protein